MGCLFDWIPGAERVVHRLGVGGEMDMAGCRWAFGRHFAPRRNSHCDERERDAKTSGSAP